MSRSLSRLKSSGTLTTLESSESLCFQNAPASQSVAPSRRGLSERSVKHLQALEDFLEDVEQDPESFVEEIESLRAMMERTERTLHELSQASQAISEEIWSERV
eukprot:s86_g6.t1